MDKANLPQPVVERRKRQTKIPQILAALCALAVLPILLHEYLFSLTTPRDIPVHAESALARCRALEDIPPAYNYRHRTESDRFDAEGAPTTLIINARILTGGENMTEVIQGDILLQNGLIKGIGQFSGAIDALKAEYGLDELVVVDANSSWVTPGIVDMHSHLGDFSSPTLNGAVDDNSHAGITLPWMRSVDGINTHDDSYVLSVSGGVTTSLILPGSGDAIGESHPNMRRASTDLVVVQVDRHFRLS